MPKMPTSALSEDSTGVQRTQNENSCDSSEATHLLLVTINACGAENTQKNSFVAGADDYLPPYLTDKSMNDI